MEEFIERLKEKYEYDDELMRFLSELVPSLVEYYGAEYEEQIYGALENCEIHIQEKGENIDKYLNKYFDTDEKKDIPTVAPAFYDVNKSVKNGQLKTIPIIYIKTQPNSLESSYKPFDFSDDKKRGTLIHEICHCVKGYGKTYMEDGKIIDETGLSKETFEITDDR